MTAVEAALRELAPLGATGALHVEAPLGAVIYLHEGRVAQIDAAAAPGIGAVLTMSGRLSEDVWQSVLTVGGPSGRVAALLVEQGYLSQGELELCGNGALFDAAYFALGAEPTAVRFAAGETSWFGGSLRVDVERLVREVAQRRELLTGAFPSSEFDEAPLVLVPRLPREQIVVDGLRWELLLNADGRHTPLELARQLGRSAFATLLEVRRLAAIGLLQAPSATGATGRPAVTPYRPAVGGSAAKTKAADRAAKPLPVRRPTQPTSGKRSAGAPSANGAALPPAASGAAVPPAAGGPVDPPAAGGPAAPMGGEGLTPLPPLPRRVVAGRPARVVRPSQQGRLGQEPLEAPATGDEPAGSHWPAPPPEIHAEPPTISSLRRFRDALQGFS